MPEPDERQLRPVIELGRHAALLLGMLGSPMTVRELYDLMQRSAASPLYDAILAEHRSGAEARESLEHLLAGGPTEVRRTLVRLERLGVVRRQLPSITNEPHLWWRLPPSEWPG